MKIRHPWLISALGLLGACLLRLWVGSLRYRYRPVGPGVMPTEPGLKQRYFYAFWHEYMLLPACHYGRPDTYVLISQHADGQLIAELIRHLRFGLIRGSTTRGGVEAIRQIRRTIRVAHVCITPDGPRGPRREIQPGLIHLAARTGLPIVAVGFGFRRPWRLNSWDRFAIPKPWSVGTCVQSRPIVVPADADKNQLEQYRELVENSLLWATEEAERWAEAS
jgi:lysophospholipid acyltransferase (LPLAT)-like uncharacterized protein